MKILLLVSLETRRGEEIRGLLEEDWMVWQVPDMAGLWEILPSVTADAGVMDLNAGESPSDWMEKVRHLPSFYPWVALLPADTQPDVLERYAPFFADVLIHPLNPFQIRWVLQKTLSRSQKGAPHAPEAAVGTVPAWAKESRTVESMERFLRFSQMLTAGFDLDRLLDLFLEAIGETLGIHRMSILLLHGETKTYRVAASRGISPEIGKNLHLKPDLGLPLWMAVRGRILRRQAPEPGKPLGTEGAIRDMEVLGSLVSIPMMDQGRLIGILNLDERIAGDPLAPLELEGVFRVAHHVAAKIEGIRRHQRLVEDLSILKAGEGERKVGSDIQILQDLVGRIAHELRNPLVAVLTFTQLLKERYEDPEVREFFYTTVSGEVDRLNQLVERLTAYVQPIEYYFSEWEILGLVEEAIAEIGPSAEAGGIRIVREFPKGKYPVKADKAQIVRAFGYILQRALGAMSVGGALAVRVSPLAGRLEIKVEDTGPGMSAEELKRVFDPFYAAKERGGSGMGFLLSQKIVEDHRGSIRVESTPRHGTVFTMELPQVNAFHGGLHAREKEHSNSGR
jgi:signal transduction histidine kinase